MIALSRGKLVAHWLVLVVSSIVSGVHGKFRLHLPWACSVLNGKGHLVGACTIFDRTKVLVSPENFNETVPGSNPPRTFYQDLIDGGIFVHAGSNYMNSDLVQPKPKYAKKFKAARLTVVFKIPSDPNSLWDFHHNPPHVRPEDGAEFDVFGLAFNVGFLLVEEEFDWSPYVQPLLLIGAAIEEDTRLFIEARQSVLVQKYVCMTYSWSQKLNKIRYHEVMYVKKDNCLDMYCKWKLSRCLEFPTKDYLTCFKSTKFADVCPSARGAALHCPQFGKSAFAILTTAPSCGLRNMPGVYTTLPKVMQFFDKNFNLKFDYAKRAIYDVFSLEQHNDDYEGIP